MSDVIGFLQKIQEEETSYIDSLSQRLIQKCAANINELLDQYGNRTILGEIKISALSVEQFIARRGSGWVPMIGQDIAGSDYAPSLLAIKGDTILPDMRGKFMRVSDNGRNLDREPARNYNSDQDDVNTSHRHGMTLEGGSIAGDLKDFSNARIWDGVQVSFGAPPGGTAPQTAIDTVGATSGSGLGRIGSTGGEMRPRNVSINHFIRINL